MHFSAQEYQPKGYLGSICAKEHQGKIQGTIQGTLHGAPHGTAG
jgi:hypothetical protein